MTVDDSAARQYPDLKVQLTHRIKSLTFVVVRVDSHLEIHADKLSQMPHSLRVFRPKDWSDLEHPLHVTGDAHLLGQLGRLGE